MTRFYLIRHGETEWNVTGRWQGHTDIPLNRAGREQAMLLAERLYDEGIHFTALYSSDLQRAWETARIVGKAVGLEPTAVVELREIDMGVWSGLTRAEIARLDPATLERLDMGEDLPRGGAERLTDLYERASAALEAIAEEHPEGDVLIATHGGTVRALIEHARTNGHAVWPWPYVSIGNTALSIIEATPEAWHVFAVNDMAHLANAPQAIDVMARTPDDAQQA